MPKMIKQYLDPTRNDKSLQLAMANGPFGAMTNDQSDYYPLATRVLKKFFQLSPQILAPTLPSFPSRNVMLQLPSEIDKESEAKKGIIKLMLVLIHGDMDIGSDNGIKHLFSTSIKRHTGRVESTTYCSS